MGALPLLAASPAAEPARTTPAAGPVLRVTVTPTPPPPSTPASARPRGPIVLTAASPTPTAGPTRQPTPRPARAARLELPNGEVAAVTRSRAVPVGGGLVQWDVPRADAGQHDGTPGCGEAGNTIIVGHSIWYGERGVFAGLVETRVGQLIRCVNDDGRVYAYRVSRTWESPYEDGSWLAQPADGRDRLTLYTCRTDLTALVVVQAERVDHELE